MEIIILDGAELIKLQVYPLNDLFCVKSFASDAVLSVEGRERGR